MAFSDSAVSAVKAVRSDGDLFVSWSSTAPEGTFYQLYVDRVLVWAGTARRAAVPFPPRTSGSVHVGAVGPTERKTDFSSSLPSPAPTRPYLAWRGGTYLGDDIAGFHVYASATPGGLVDYAGGPVATVTAYPQGVVMDGFGLGGFGGGGFGQSESSYAWTGPALPPGVWKFSVKTFDTAGNESTAFTATLTAAGPPPPPGRLTPASRAAVVAGALTWAAPDPLPADFWRR